MSKILAVFVVLVVLGLAYWRDVYARSLVRGWAEANGFKFLHFNARSTGSATLRRNQVMKPVMMMLTSSRNQFVFHVAVYDLTTHRMRSAWVRIGGFWLGLLDKDAIDVEWDDAP